MVDKNRIVAKLSEYAPYFHPNSGIGVITVSTILLQDIYELLKSDEPVKPIHLHNTKIHDSLKDVVFEDECGNCNGYLLRPWKACPICGRKVKWDG